MTTVTIEEAQTQLSDVIHRLQLGEEVIVTKNDQVVVRIVRESTPTRKRPGPGLCKGMITIVSDDDEHLRDFEEYMP